MAERKLCPECGNPGPEDATEAELLADPPRMCSPLRCSAWTIVGKATKPHPITGRQNMLRVIKGGASEQVEGEPRG